MPDDPSNTLPLPRLLTLGDPRLARPSAPVDVALIRTPEFQERLQVLGRAMVEYLGIGIAAPQIGWFERVFLMLLESEGSEVDASDETNESDGDAHELQVWINPELVSVSEEWTWAWEGCLSVPGWRGWIRRPAAVAVRGLDERGEPLSREFRGWSARVFQHEIDHLEGMLFPYRAVDPRHLVMTGLLDRRETWPEDWPAPGARDTPQGVVYSQASPGVDRPPGHGS